jgi:type III secretion protein W
MVDPKVSGSVPVNPLSLVNLQRAIANEQLQQVESQGDLRQWMELDAFNPMAMMRRFRPLPELKEDKTKAEQKERPEDKKILAIAETDEAASRYQKNNSELSEKTLHILKARITAHDTAEVILKKVLATYADFALADEALDFLIETSEGELRTNLLRAKEDLNARHGQDIRAGRNMGAESRAFSKEGLGSAMSLRDIYRSIIATPREPIQLFDELSDQFPYEKMTRVIQFVLHSLGADLRSKGPSISRAELKRLIDETRSLQGILGIYRFFKGRMALIKRQFSSHDMDMPSRVTFESIARLFVKFLAERFLSPDKIIQASRFLGISDEEIAQIIIYTQMRDAVKQIAPRYYRNVQHRDELLKAILKALEELEEKIEDEDEEGKK